MNSAARPAAAAATDRAVADLVREGVVDSVDLAAGKAIVRLGDLFTPPIDWAMAVGDTTIWIPPTVGQPVTVTCPEGDIERAFISGSLPSSQMAPLFLGASVGIRFKDGAIITYDPQAQKLHLQLTGAAELVAPEGLSLKADVDIEGDVTVKGGLKASGVVEGEQDVVFAGTSAKSHTHGGVSAGTGFSGPPR
ncbi:phage baseplate assembly protein V [Brevundimonas bullata]|uniref:Phage baseplate assembly protein V n=1 Tax=Brevundimonas bullata TaxID=13160 RepID=A0A7W7INU9_9CAUL|nr:phage baseplate assembly protein V [Brevundimonas bullata]MBB4797578.1 phage baseplate assembly protein V [Brevundimonas bullata]MBB6382538.1 phage baseplate assembly protein V [Brevundimonas bullata]